jgi:enamine deaminase RidA (YjgF/YER057c/UK114 family)
MIQRHEILKGIEGAPVISQAVVRDSTVYLAGITGDPSGDVTTQTRQVLRRIDDLLEQAGTDKSRLLTEWVDQDNPPVRACVESRLFWPGLLVEIMATAALP